jgi:hypothetical protein
MGMRPLRLKRKVDRRWSPVPDGPGSAHPKSQGLDLIEKNKEVVARPNLEAAEDVVAAVGFETRRS